MRYDLPDIAPRSTITRVVLEISQVRVRSKGEGSPKAATIRGYRVTDEWVEGEGTDSPYAEPCGGGATVDGVNWDNAPEALDDFSFTEPLPGRDSSTIIVDTDVGTNDNGLIKDSQSWVDNNEENQGWMLTVLEGDIVDNARLLDPPIITIYWTEDEGIPINAGLNDAWFNLETAGQGFFFTVFPDEERFFLAWFTFDVERPDESVEAILGDAGHRWLTAIGPWEGNTVILDVELTSGGVFDSTEPMPVQEAGYGTVTIVFHDCDNATLSYEIPSIGRVGTIELTRLAPDNIALCESMIGM